MKKKKSILNSLKQLNKADLIIYFILIIFSFLSVYNLYVYSPDMKFDYRIIFYGLVIFGDIFAIIIYNYFKRKKQLPIEKKFFIISLFVGMLYMLCIPTMKGTDEPPHLFRIYQISQGNIIVSDYEKDENVIPANLFSYAWGWGAQAYNPNKVFEKVSLEKIELNNGHVPYRYPPTQYIPQLVGFNLARLLGLGPILTGLLTRFANFIAWLFISYYAIKKLPVHKGFAVLLYSAPATLSLVSTMSGDAFLNACALYFIATVFDIYFNRRKVSNKELITIILLSIIISSIKMVYIPIIFLVFLLKREQFKNDNKMDKFILVILGIVFSIITALLWNKFSSPPGVIGNSVLESKQYEFIFQHPIQYCFITFRTFTNNIVYYITNLFAGHEMCYTIVKINEILVIAYCLFAFFSLKTEKNRINLSKIQKKIIWIFAFLIFCAIATVMYACFTIISGGVGNKEIVGVQSRYFIIIVPILISTIKVKYDKSINLDNIINYSLIINVLILFEAISSLIAACYNG